MTSIFLYVVYIFRVKYNSYLLLVRKMTWWFAKVLIKLFIFFTISNHILTESSKLNILDYVKRNFYNFHTNNSKDFIFTLSNSSNHTNNRINFKSNQVDCFGLGKRLAGILEWFFLNNSNGTNALDVQFFLSSRRQPKRVEVMIGKQFGLEWTDFQIERPTIIIVHGFLSHGQELWINEMEKSFLLWVKSLFLLFFKYYIKKFKQTRFFFSKY